MDVHQGLIQIRPYPCISNGGFVSLRERHHGEYQDVLNFATEGGKLCVDLGCCCDPSSRLLRYLTTVGTDVREFLLDGGDANGANRIVGVDLRQDFLDLGQKLYSGPTKGIEFRMGNILDKSDMQLDDLKGKVQILYTGAVFHLFSEDDQRSFAENIKSLLATEGEVVAFGVHRGARQKGMRIRQRSQRMGFSHDPESWKEMWREVLGDDANISWTMKAELHNNWTEAGSARADSVRLQWSIWRNKPSA
jgi:SAM-dependent methyltransferase